ncbi:MAG: hypothetical protein CMF80_06765 [Candidatus Marinimicrobia bacterium]|nr:hypothetical protein [Candidatus Neomarinimicrobiota bacterium]
MWIRSKEGKLVEITRDTYFSDKDYYAKITKLETGNNIVLNGNSKNKILSILDVKNFDKRII